MKWIILAILFFGQVMMLSAADLSLKVFGTVTDIVAGTPVEHQEIAISVENYNPPLYVVEHVLTDETGFYIHQFFLPLNYGQITVTTFDCESVLQERSFIFSFNNNLFQADFQLCTGTSTSCNADFAHDYNPDNPMVLQFTDQSEGNIHLWEWTFGDGTTSNLQHPIHQFLLPAVYMVCLKVTDTTNHCESITCDFVAVENPSTCSANYSFLPVEGNPLTFKFIDQSVGNPEHWLWDFGDGNTSDDKNPVHQYSEPGVYNICVTISNSSGTCNDDHCEYLIANENPPCKAYFTYEETSVDPYTIKFSDSSYGNIAYWQWNFGDGSVSLLAEPYHVFMNPGVYVVCLTIDDTINNCSHTYCETIFAGVQRNCEATFSYSQTFLEDNIIEFFDMSVGNVTDHYWTFGDGTESHEENPIHEFPGPGMYLVCLEISNDMTECIDSYCYEISILEDISCQANFDIVPDSQNPYRFSFQNLSSSNSGLFLWDFGDGEGSIEKNPVHEYLKAGLYKVCLLATDSNLICYDEVCKNLVIENIYLDCTAAFSFENFSSPDTIQFFDESEGFVDYWFWDFGDGYYSLEANPLHVFQNEGTFNVCLTIDNPVTNCSDMICKTVIIEFPAPCVSMFSYTIDIQNPLKVTFDNQSNGVFTSSQWSFGDGSGSNELNPDHIFPGPGSYNICLEVSNLAYPQFCSDILCQEVLLEVPQPACNAAFHYFLDTISGMPYRYYFINDSEGSELEYNWTFSTGEQIFTRDADIQFGQSGLYEVTLTVSSTDTWGQSCSDSFSVSIQTPVYYSLGGLVFAGDYPINNPVNTQDTAVGYLYRVYSNQIIPLDTTFFSELGYYHYPYLREGKYLLKTHLTGSSARFSQFGSTYYGEKSTWQDAVYIEMTRHFNNADIHLNGSAKYLFAGGSITGNVSVESHPVLFPQNSLRNITVILSDENGVPVKTALTGPNGDFWFSALKLGKYYIEADITGLESGVSEIILDESNTHQQGVLIEAWYPSQVGIDDKKQDIENLEVFPNPAGNEFFIRATAPDLNICCIVLRSPLGNFCKTIKEVIHSDELFRVDLETVPKGIIYVEVYSKYGLVETKKVIKVR